MNVYTLNEPQSNVYYESKKIILSITIYSVLIVYLFRLPLPSNFSKHAIAVILSVICYHIIFDTRINVQVVSEKHHDSILAH